MKDIKKIYEKRKKYYNNLINKQEKTINFISRLRLIDTIAAIICFTFFYKSKNYYIAWTLVVIYTLIFIYLIILHDRAKRFKAYISALYKLNDSSIKRLTNEWNTFEDVGGEFKNDYHPYSQDLDIFGIGSLFQLINSANTSIGRQMLKKALTHPQVRIEEIIKRQLSIAELSKMLWWRQRFSSEGMIVSSKVKSEEELFQWASKSNKLYKSRLLTIILRILPLITISVLIISYVFQLIPTSIFKLLAIFQFTMLFLWGKERNIVLDTVYKYKNSIKAYVNMLEIFEKTKFKSPYLIELQTLLKNSKGQSAFQQFKGLEKIVDSISNRRNPMFLPINVMLLWDYQCMIALEQWKSKSGSLIKKWIETIGELESLSSLAIIKHDYPDWAVPEFTEEPSIFRSKSIGHPLLTNKQVYNDLFIEDPTKVLLITGSNMSGKSTLLRTIGINLVLAYAGAPVCAKYLMCSIMKVYTCMRVSDNLEKSISSFYAEILRIKEIVNASKQDSQVFFLLDEIFKGTNSHDRHIGAKLLIKQLSKNNSIGLVSTHDLELGELESESNCQIKNYHFQEYYENGKIFFDYKLKPGISTTSNALYLIRLAGIDNNT